MEKRSGSSIGALYEVFGYDALGRLTMASVGAPMSNTSTVQLWYGNTGTSGYGTGNGYVDEPVKETQKVSSTTRTILRTFGTLECPECGHDRFHSAAVSSIRGTTRS